MTRLTVYIKDCIVNKAIEKAGCNKEMTAYSEKRASWACRVADESIGGAEAVAKLAEANKKIAAIVSKLPKEFQYDLCAGPMVGALSASFGGCRTYVNEWAGDRPGKPVMLAADHPLSIEFFALEDERKVIDEKRDGIKRSVRAAVNSVTTVGKLLSIWPEAAELLPTSAAPAPQLPAVQVSDLNEAIGLPSSAYA